MTSPLSVTPGALTILRGGAATSTISLARMNGFNGSVQLAISGVPNGVSASFSSIYHRKFERADVDGQ